MEGIAVETFGAEVQVRGNELFRLAQEEISARLQVKMQALDQCDALGTGKVWQDVHAENTVKASDIAGAGQIHAIESHQASQPWFHQQVRGTLRGTGSAVLCWSRRSPLCFVLRDIRRH